MPELIEIFYILGIFFLFCSSPLNIFKIETNNHYFNLIINLNILLIFSILPLNISEYATYILLILFILSIRNYYLCKKNISKELFNKYQIILVILTYFIIAVQVASQLELGWDAKWFWYIKSLFYTQSQTFSELSNYIYNDFHPHLGSFLWAFFRNFSINEYEYIGRLFYVFFYILGIHFISNNIYKNKIKNMILFIFLIVIIQKYIYFSGLQEILIFTTLIFISKFISIFIVDRKFINLFFISLCMNLLIWFKAEGIAYAAICFIVVNSISKLKMKSRIIFNLLFLSAILFKTLIYGFFKIKINDQPYNLEYLVSLNFEVIVFKLYNILIYFSYNSFKSIILFLVPIVIIMNYKKIFKSEYLRLISIFFILNVMFIFSAYMFREMEVVYSLKTTIDRIVFASSGFYLVFLIDQIKKYT